MTFLWEGQIWENAQTHDFNERFEEGFCLKISIDSFPDEFLKICEYKLLYFEDLKYLLKSHWTIYNQILYRASNGGGNNILLKIRKENSQKLTQFRPSSHPIQNISREKGQHKIRRHQRHHQRQPGEQPFPIQVATG